MFVLWIWLACAIVNASFFGFGIWKSGTDITVFDVGGTLFFSILGPLGTMLIGMEIMDQFANFVLIKREK